jgi:hypothetical protein
VPDQKIEQAVTSTIDQSRFVIDWKARGIGLHSGERMVVRDYRLYAVDVRRDSRLVAYSVKYQLLNGKDDVVFRFCTHGMPLSGMEPCHIHVGADRTINDGDGALDGISLVAADFLR